MFSCFVKSFLVANLTFVLFIYLFILICRVMDSDNHLLPDGGLEAAHQNGGHQQSPAAGEDGVVSNNLNGSVGNTFKLDDGTTDNLSTGEVEDELKAYVGSNGLPVFKVRRCSSLCI
jgi:hypothetical protein